MHNYSDLIDKLDNFIRKYYKNELLKGGIFFVGLTLSVFLLIITLEFFGNFNSFVRGFFFYTFLLSTAFIVFRFLINPLLKLYSFGNRISYEQAAKIIGQHFPEIDDKIINTIQLNNNTKHNELLSASIAQKTKLILSFPILKIIDFKHNKRYVLYVLPVLVLFVCIGVFFPNFISEQTKKVVAYNQVFTPKAPFTFSLLNKNLVVHEDKDYNILLKLHGEKIPDKIYLVSENGKFLMNKENRVLHNFTLSKLKSDLLFHFEGNNFVSQTYKLKVFSKTSLGKFEASIVYPTYLNKPSEQIKNVGDLELPKGSLVQWRVLTKNTTSVFSYINGKSNEHFTNGFNFSTKVFNNSNYGLILKNTISSFIDTLNYSIKVIEDQYPEILVNQKQDSNSTTIHYFNGSLSDDYGLTRLYFNYTIVSKDGKERKYSKVIQNLDGTKLSFSYAYDFMREKLTLEDKVYYSFSVYDNDGVNGNKKSNSSTFTFELPSLQELNENRSEELNNTKSELQNLLKKADNFKKEIKQLKKDISNSKQSDWKQKSQLETILNNQQELKEELNSLQEKLDLSLFEKNELSPVDKELLEQQELLDKLLDEVMDEELKSLLEELQKLMDQQNKFQMDKNLDKLDMKAEDMSKQMERSIELLKKMQVNEKIDDIVKELNDLKNKQDKLNEELNKEGIKEQIKEKQEELNKQFNDLKKDFEKLNDLNNDLKKPLSLDDLKDREQEISNEFNDTKENLSNNKKNKSSNSQKEVSKKLDNLAKDLEDKKEKEMQQQQKEDMQSLRNILESLLLLSLDQEKNMNDFIPVRDNDPFYKKLAKHQRKIINDSKQLEDSLISIANRQPKLSTFINKELNQIKTNFHLGLENIDEHRKRDFLINLQYVMTSYNNLALMLNESLQNMQNQMQNSSPGSGSCNNPGGSGKKPSDGNDGDMKEMLKKQLESMKKGMNEGGTKPGDKQGQGLGFQNKELAKMAAQQSALRQKLEQLRNELNKDGKRTGNKLSPLIDKINEQEKDLINKKLDKEVIKRQQEIITRLLESEKAINERGFDERRESKSPKNLFESNQNKIDEYNKQKLRQIDMLRSVDPTLKHYYQTRANDYFNVVL